MSSTLLQYRRKAMGVHPPVAATMSGGTPERRRATAPPIRKQCPERFASLSLPQALETKDIKSFLTIGDHEPESDLWEKRGVLGGADGLTLMWLMKAATGQSKSSRAQDYEETPILCGFGPRDADRK